MSLEDPAGLQLVREPLGGELADRLQHPEAVAGVAEEALLDERLEDVEVGVADVFGGVEGAAAAEDGEAGEELSARLSVSSSCDHSIVARRVCWRGSASRPPLSRSSRWPSRSRICAGVRTRVRAAASSTASGMSSSRRQSSAIVSSGSSRERVAEELDRLRLGQRGTGYSTSPLIRSSSRLVTRSLRFGQAASSSRELGRGLDDLLEVVEQQQQLAVSPTCSARPSFAPSVCAIVSRHERRVAQRGQADPEDAGLEGRARARRPTSSASRVLPEPPGPGERDEARAVPKQSDAARPAPGPADERGGRPRQVRVRDRLQRREALAARAGRAATGSSKSLAGARRARSARRRRAPASPPRRRPGRRGRKRRSGRPGAARARRNPRRSAAARRCARPSAPWTGPGASAS